MSSASALRAERARRELGPAGLALLRQFPPRGPVSSWPVTAQPLERVSARLLRPPFELEAPGTQARRRVGLGKLLAWLEQQPGQTWQDRWLVSGADAAGNIEWRHRAIEWLQATGRAYQDPKNDFNALGSAVLVLISADVIRPSLSWLLNPGTVQILTAEMARSRDPDGFDKLLAVCRRDPANKSTKDGALRRIATIMAAKGGRVGDITVGDCLELLEVLLGIGGSVVTSAYFYQLLHTMGVFPMAAPPTVRAVSGRAQGQQPVEEMIDRYQLACRPVRDLLVDYLRERQLAVDYASLRSVAFCLGKLFWKDLEDHHPGINSLRLTPEVAASWKQRIATKTVHATTASGERVDTRVPRVTGGVNYLAMVRAFYLDLAQWAMDDPARWGVWAAPCPIRADELSRKKDHSQRKSRMDQRTRERLPVLLTLARTVDDQRRVAAERLAAAQAATPGAEFTVAGHRWRRRATKNPAAKLWAEDVETGQRQDLSLAEYRAFWAWAVVEVLRHTGIRVEELTELSHHSLVQYRLPDSGELVPLLQIAPSKTDAERLLVIDPELADVLSAIICRIRDTTTGAVPLVTAYDSHERVWNSPMPLLFQRPVGVENRPIPIGGIRKLLDHALAQTGLTDPSGAPLQFSPHDFRRLFITDAILNGMPPHIAQLVVGHGDINTTMGYKAVYPQEVINGHRSFIARRRATRPSEEYRTPTDEEWDEFLGHFQRRRVALGDCGRAYGAGCVHEHSCLRCSLLRPDPAQRPRILEIRDNLTARIAEAQHEGWLGEVEGLQVSLVGAEQKLTQLDDRARRSTTIALGLPSFSAIAGRTVTATASTSGTR